LDVKDNALWPSQHIFDIYLRKIVPGSENKADLQQGKEEGGISTADARTRKSTGAEQPGTRIE
jgi:hypothetical protein